MILCLLYPDNIEVAFLKTVTKEDVLAFYRVGILDLVFDLLYLDKIIVTVSFSN